MATLIESLLPSVHDTLSLREALSKLSQCERHLKSQGVLSIIDNFNIVYSCYCNIKELKTSTLEEIINLLIKGLQALEIDLKKVLSEKLTNDVRVKYLNTLKILTYLVVEFANFLEKKEQNSNENEFMATNKKTKKTTAKKTTNLEVTEACSTLDWNDLREKVLDSIAKLVILNIQKLWDPPIAEEQFVIMITNLCYKFMETCQSSSLKPLQKKTLKDHLCHIVGIMIKKYNHSYGACVTIVQTLSHYEHFSALYADLIQTCVVQLGYDSILPDLLREFHHANVNAANSADDGKENPNTKFYAQFLTDLADRLAPNLLPYLSLIQEFLDDDAYLMRNAVLYAYGEIIVRVLNRDAANDLKLKQMRNELLDTLMEHTYDSNAVARSKTLQIWRRICEENAIPLNYIGDLMKRTISRMEDVASSVRKSAFQLLCDLIRNNPFGIKIIEMSLEQIESELAKEQQALDQLNAENDKLIDEINQLVEKTGQKQSDEEMETDSDDSPEDSPASTAAVDDVELEAKRQKHQQLVLIQTSKVNYLKDMLSFVTQIQAAIPKLSKILFSKTQTDVLEVISFFVTCYEHGFTDMLAGIRKMLSVMLYSEKTIKDAVVNAYKRLYLNREHTPVQKAKQLIKLVQDLSVCERVALEELIGEFAISNELDTSVIQILWEIFATTDQPAQNRLHALVILSMVIKKIPSKGRANIQVLLDYGLASPGEAVTNHDLLRFAETCLALSYISPDTNSKQLTQVDKSTGSGAKKRTKATNQDETLKDESYVQPKLQFNSEPFKLVNSHALFERLGELVPGQFDNLNTIYWCPFVENALHCIFKLADNPIVIVEGLINKCMDKMPALRSVDRATRLPPVPLFNEDEMATEQTLEPSATSELASELNNVPVDYLSRFFTLVGLVATKLLVFLNQFVVCELKRRKMCKENRSNLMLSQKNKDKEKEKKSGKRKSIAPNGPTKSAKSSLTASASDIALEEEMGLQGAEAEDVELLFIDSVLEQKVAVSSATCRSQLAQLLPLILFVLKNPGTFSSEGIQLSASMALMRLMILSKRLCSENLQLLFTLMEKSTNPNVRSQLIVGIGDLVYRFPNTLEPWTGHLYLPLRDTKANCVRMNTIRVLSHLILKELIKTRGQIYEIALCTIDPEQQISSLAKLFFQELSQRNNGLVIYNAMPDIISQLSDGGEAAGASQANVLTQASTKSTASEHLSAREIPEESFRTVVTYLFSFIKRDKQCETLIEKLCQGFRMANTSERKCRDLVFCLSKIQLSESGIKKIKESFKWYADKLTIPVVYDTFKTSILKNARKLPTLRNETKLLIDELEKQIEEVKQKGLEAEQ